MDELICKCPHESQCVRKTCYCAHVSTCECMNSQEMLCCYYCKKALDDETIKRKMSICNDCYIVARNQCPKGDECRLYQNQMCTYFHGMNDKRPQCPTPNCFKRRHPEHTYCWFCMEKRKTMYREHACRFTGRCKFANQCMDMHGPHDPRPICGGCFAMTDGADLCLFCTRTKH